jgi:hypothetical protein
MREKWCIEGLIHGEKRSYARAELTLPPSWDINEDREIQLDNCWAMFKHFIDYLRKGWIDKRGRKQSYKFEYAIFWEFGKKHGRIHPHLIIDRRIPREVFRKAAVKTGFGARIRLNKIADTDESTYRYNIIYAAKYVSKGGWNVTVGKKRFDMSLEYRKSCKKYMDENKKPFDGIITDDFGRAVINEDSIIEDLAFPEKFYDRGELGRAGIASGDFDPSGIARGRMIVDRQGASAMDIRPRRGPVTPFWAAQDSEPVRDDETPDFPLIDAIHDGVGYYLMVDGELQFIRTG